MKETGEVVAGAGGSGMLEVGNGGRIGGSEPEPDGTLGMEKLDGETTGIEEKVLEDTPVGRTPEGVERVADSDVENPLEASELDAGRLGSEGIDGAGSSGNSGPSQPNSIKWIATLHFLSSLNMGRRRLTEVAPPHCLFLTTVPSGEQRVVCLQMAPSGMPKEKTTSVSISVETWKDVIEKPLWPLYARVG